ncbi:sigma-70 family RNA polymerase sigma factor [Mesorhizobium sp.]|uniref:RNA polymerase sigma factor n=1 Tax=Mesorhizobium sp. TaxID=1871066 RepID=UPI0025CF2E5B|nr:sigma-70 family RNA polymerase sigma factor [Mesorhizobium sp.]
MRRYAQSQCTGAGDADDAVQETLWLVYQRIGALRTVTSFSAWVFAIVRRECHRMWRRMNGQTELPPDDPPSFVYRPDPELRQDLIAAIHSLPDKYRDVIVDARGRQKPHPPGQADDPRISGGLEISRNGERPVAAGLHQRRHGPPRCGSGNRPSSPERRGRHRNHCDHLSESFVRRAQLIERPPGGENGDRSFSAGRFCGCGAHDGARPACANLARAAMAA